MKKRGFTLIELLAVIVVLAIIALIATPIVINVIKNANAGAAERSADNYLKAVDTLIATEKLDGTPLVDGTYRVDANGNLTFGENSYTVEVSGTKPVGGTIKIENGQVVKDSSTVVYKNHTVTYSNGVPVAKEKLILCTANTSRVMALVWKSGPGREESSYAEEEVGLLASIDGAYTPGVSYTCNFINDDDKNDMAFYVISSTENDVTLISGSNLGGYVAWSKDGSNHKDDPEDQQAVTAKTALANRTANWSKIKGLEGITIKMPTVLQMNEFADSTAHLPTWLISHAKPPVNAGYWTSTPYAGSSNTAAMVNVGGKINNSLVNISSSIGVRPVITISKGNISL